MKKLFNNYPLVVDKYLAKILGLNEAIVLQQINYWLKINKENNNNFHDGRYWTYNTIDKWQEEFPFWSKDTVKRIFNKLRKMDILLTGNYNKLKVDRTLWYSIDYEELGNQLEEAGYPFEETEVSKEENITDALDENAQIQKVNINSPIPETSTEINTENNIQSISQPEEKKKTNKRLTDRSIEYTNFDEKYEMIISNCYIDSLDETYRLAVTHAIRLLLLDIESNSKVKIGDNYIPSSIVYKDLEKLDYFTLEYAINKFKKISRSVNIRNTIGYLKTCIYNSINEKKVEVDAKLRFEGIV